MAEEEVVTEAEPAAAEPTTEAEPVVAAPEPEAEPVAADWREAITDDDAKQFADSSTDINHFVKRTMDMRQKLSNSIVIPGKDASDDDVIAYNKALGIPGSPNDYEFPSVPEMTDEIKASQNEWATRFHALGVPKEVATALIEAVNKDGLENEAALVEADKVFAEKQSDALKAEWKGEDYGINIKFANRALEDLSNRAGLSIDALRQIETKGGRFLMDRPEMVKMLAAVGREMAEGTLGPSMSST